MATNEEFHDEEVSVVRKDQFLSFIQQIKDGEDTSTVLEKMEKEIARGTMNLINIVNRLQTSSSGLSDDEIEHLEDGGLYCKEAIRIKDPKGKKNMPRVSILKHDLERGKIVIGETYAAIFVKTPKRSTTWKKHEKIIKKYRELCGTDFFNFRGAMDIVRAFNDDEILQFLDWQVDEMVDESNQRLGGRIEITFDENPDDPKTFDEKVNERIDIVLKMLSDPGRPSVGLMTNRHLAALYHDIKRLLTDPIYTTDPKMCWKCESENISIVDSFKENGENLPHDLIVYECGDCGEKMPIIPIRKRA